MRALALLSGLLSRGGAWASHRGGCSGFGAQAPGAQHWAALPAGAQARGLWHPGLAAPWRVRAPGLGTEPCLLRRQAAALPLILQGSLASVSDVAHGSRNSPRRPVPPPITSVCPLCLCPCIFSHGELQSLLLFSFSWSSSSFWLSFFPKFLF